MNVNFSQKRLDKYRSYFQVSLKTLFHTFCKILGGIVFTDFEKIWEFSKKFPIKYLENGSSYNNQSRSSGAEHRSPLVFFFKEFRTRGWRTRLLPIFEKKRWRANGKPIAGSPSQWSWNLLIEYVGEKARNHNNGAGIFIFYLGGSALHPKLPQFWGNFGCEPLDKRLIFLKAKLYFCLQRTHVIIFRPVVLKYTQAKKSYFNFKKWWKISVKNLINLT